MHPVEQHLGGPLLDTTGVSAVNSTLLRFSKQPPIEIKATLSTARRWLHGHHARVLLLIELHLGQRQVTYLLAGWQHEGRAALYSESFSPLLGLLKHQVLGHSMVKEPYRKLYLKMQGVLAQQQLNAMNLPPPKKHRPSPAKPRHGIPPLEWPNVQGHVIENQEPLRQVAAD